MKTKYLAERIVDALIQANLDWCRMDHHIVGEDSEFEKAVDVATREIDARMAAREYIEL